MNPPWLDLPSRTGRRATLAQLAVCALTALLWVLASPPYGLWPLAWIAMLPSIWLWARAGTARRATLLGWATGAGMTIGGFYWFAGMMQHYAGLSWPLAILCLLGLAAYQGLPYLVAARVIWRVRAWRRLPMALVAPAAIVALEHLWPVIFPYQIAFTQAPALPVIQIADLVGAPAITALLVATAGALYDLIEAPRRRRPAVAVAAALAVTLAYGFWRVADVADTRAAAPHLRIGIVQPNEPMSLGPHDYAAERRRLAAMQDETARLEADGAQLVIWSETAYPVTLPRSIGRDLQADSPWVIRRGFTVPVVIGAITEEKGDGRRRHFNSSLLLVGDRVIARHDKVHRVIGSEWNPVVEWFPTLAGTLPPGFAGGDAPVILPVDIAGVPLRMGPMICLEDIIARFGRAVAAEHPNLLVNQTIDTWFGTFAEPAQHRALAVLRTVEARADMVRSVNTGPSGLIESTGRLGPQTAVRDGDPGVEGLLVDVAITDAGHTLYARIGDLFAWLCVAATIFGWWVSREEKKHPHEEAEHRRRRRARADRKRKH